MGRNGMEGEISSHADLYLSANRRKQPWKTLPPVSLRDVRRRGSTGQERVKIVSYRMVLSELHRLNAVGALYGETVVGITS